MNSIMLLSVLIGGLFAVATGLILYYSGETPTSTILLSLFSGGFGGFVLHMILSIADRRTNKRYAALEKDIRSPIFYKTNGNFILEKSVKNGNIYFCDDGLVFISVDYKPVVREDIPLSNISRVDFDGAHVKIRTEDDRIFLIMIPDVAKVREVLRGKRWIP